jgi:hypothetical protein
MPGSWTDGRGLPVQYRHHGDSLTFRLAQSRVPEQLRPRRARRRRVPPQGTALRRNRARRPGSHPPLSGGRVGRPPAGLVLEARRTRPARLQARVRNGARVAAGGHRPLYARRAGLPPCTYSRVQPLRRDQNHREGTGAASRQAIHPPGNGLCAPRQLPLAASARVVLCHLGMDAPR